MGGRETDCLLAYFLFFLSLPYILFKLVSFIQSYSGQTWEHFVTPKRKKESFILVVVEENTQLFNRNATLVSRPENSQETEQPCYLTN